MQIKLPNYLKTLILLVALSGLTPPTYAYQATNAEFQQWIVSFKQEARKQGISPNTLDKSFKGVTLNQRVLELDAKQPEFFQTFWQYFEARVTETRINKGTELLKQHQQLLDQVAQKYGVPGRFLIAFWGMETNYGSYTGKMPIIESLATLAYNPRRSEFFTKQLINALQIVEKGFVQPEQMYGSWAGAMGQTQFMPYNYLTYSVDGDADGKVNLWDSLPDVFHSSGNFLKNLGWKAEENWGREVKLPQNFDYQLADGKTKQPLSYWKQQGITLADGRALPNAELEAALLLPSDYRGPAFLVYHNFFVIKRWNMSNSYALAVGHIADRLVGRGVLEAKKPADDKALTREDVTRLQTHLNRLGYKLEHLDGIAGQKTRDALRRFQLDNNIPADGHPSHLMLNTLANKR